MQTRRSNVANQESGFLVRHDTCSRLFATALAVCAIQCLAARDYYVDANNGNDEWDGTSATRGEGDVGPRKTLVKAMSIPGLASGDVVHAAEGRYNEGAMWANNSSNRVGVVAGVGLKASGRVEETIIEGHSSETSDNGIGPDAVRCVRLDAGAWIQGFTITGGRTPSTRDGGGIYAKTGSAAIDCIVTGNGCGNRGTGMYGGWCIRCRFFSNDKAGDYAAYLTQGLVSCAFTDGDVCYGARCILNCYLDGGDTWSTSLRFSPVYNSCINKDSGYYAYTNCVFRSKASTVRDTSTYDSDTCRFAVNFDGNFDSDFRPLLGTLFVDAGSKELYDKAFPADWEQFKDRDFASGARIYNRQIDIGCGEHDWRSTFSGKLNDAGKAAVVAASANVTTNALDGVLLGGGDSVEVAYTLPDGTTAHSCTFKVDVSGEGAATAQFGEKVLVPDAAGTYMFRGDAGENRVIVSFTGEGSAVLSAFSGPHVGVRFMIR